MLRVLAAAFVAGSLAGCSWTAALMVLEGVNATTGIAKNVFEADVTWRRNAPAVLGGKEQAP